MQRFPHLAHAPEAFGAGRDVYEQIPGEFDHSRWEEDTARYKLMSVPWCGDYDNVVDFGSDEARDAWIDAAPGVSGESAWRRAPTSTYRVEVPYTSALDYNYLVLDLPTETSSTAPLPGTSANRVRRLCYFVSDMEPVAPSTTELVIDLDVWSTFFNRLDIERVMLSRGHAPMSAVSADEYLADPITNSAYLMTPDVDAGGAETTRSADVVTIDASVTPVIFTTANLAGSWGSKYGTTPTSPLTSNGAQTSPEAWALQPGDLPSFLSDAISQHPSFLQTVLAVAAVPASLVSQGATVTFCGHSLRRCTSVRTSTPMVALATSDFGYPARYQGIAKLYTSPYAHLEMTDETGAVTAIRVEDTHGALALGCVLSLAWPNVSVDTYLEGYGNGSVSVTWSTLSGSMGARLAGRWYDTLRSHDVALFAVRESAATAYDWSTHYDRAQRQLAAANANASSLASNATARTNASNSASNTTANNALMVALNNANTATRNAANTSGVGLSNTKLRTDVQYDIGNSNAAFDAQMAQLGVAATNNDARAVASASTGVVGTLAEVGANLLTGDVGGAIGAAVGGITGAANTAVDWQTSNASITVSQSNNVDVYNQAVTSAYGKQDASIAYNSAATSLGNNTASTINTATNNTQTSVANNNASLINTNAANAKTTADANANRQLQTAQSAISNDVAQAALGAPVSHGSERPGTQGTRPMMVSVTVVTEPDGAIAVAGDAMLRYGYQYDGWWEIESWVPTKHFCYWQINDLWICGTMQTPERYQRRIREILSRGVTVWKNPDEIGKVSIYDNEI